MSRPHEATFLNHTRSLEFPDAWHDRSAGLLWLYNLHYFDDLIAENHGDRVDWHMELLERWVTENTVSTQVGWDPYPTSLRIVNWIIWTCLGNELPYSCLRSLAQQTRSLRRRLEYHLMANHLMANAKALVFAGCFFEGSEALSWLEDGLQILSDEIEEQILFDGGHFERSPAYHARMVADFLDVIQLSRVYEDCSMLADSLAANRIKSRVDKMLKWQQAMTHPDGTFALFNDSAYDQAPSLARLTDYATALAVERKDQPPARLVMLRESGYARLTDQASSVTMTALLDVGSIGPSYQPGHAHAGTLSFELSLNDSRVIVDTGTSHYTEDAERYRQRGTAAHNAVVVDGADSSEVWASHRVARRAVVTTLDSHEEHDACKIWAEHTGYERLRGVGKHRREWSVRPGVLTVSDTLYGFGVHELALTFHLHPDVSVVELAFNEFALRIPGVAHDVTIRLDPALDVALEETTYHPEFGVALATRKLCGRVRGDLPITLTSSMVYDTVGIQ